MRLPVLMLLLASTASGQAPHPLTIGEAVAYARTHNASLLAAQQHVSAVRSNEVTAALRQNPILVAESTQLGLANDDPGGPTFAGAGLQRTFERGNKRTLRIDAAAATTRVAGLQASDATRTIDLAVRTAFTRMLLAKLALAISTDNLTGYRHTVELMKFRLDAGDVDRTDFERVDLQLAGFESDLTNARLNLTQSGQQLQVLLGYPAYSADFDVTGSFDPEPLRTTQAELEQTALATRPDVLAAEQQLRANAAAIKLADALGKADPILGAEYEHSGAASTFGVNLSLPLRFFDRNQGEKQRTRYEAESSRLALTQVRNQAVSDVDQAYAGYLAATEQTERYRSKYLAEAAHVRDNLEFAYRNGGATLLDYLSALQDYRQVNLAALNAQAQAQLALHQLSFVTGTEVLP